MPQFSVKLEQYVQEVATVEITAKSPEDAAEKIKRMISSGDDLDPDWSDGDDVQGVDVRFIRDANGKIVWSRSGD